MSSILIVPILLVLVLVHELGHFLAAKKQDIYVEEFGFGFPPKVIGKKIGETLYSLNLLPIGGFVKLYGEEYHQSNKKLNGKHIPEHRAFVNKKPWQKSIVIIGGVIMNFLLGWVLISYLFTVGTPVPDGVVIESVQENSPGEYAGLQSGDMLLYITHEDDSVSLQSTQELIDFSKKYADEEIEIGYSRNGAERSVEIVPRSKPPAGQGALGVVIIQNVTVKKYPWYQAPFYGLVEATHMTKRIAVEIAKLPSRLITGSGGVDFAGPIGIAQIVGEASEFGINALLQITALLSLNLAVVNILPFPALDGGRLLFVVYEWITGKKTNEKLEQYLNTAGITLLLLLTLVITIFDVAKIVRF